MASTMMNGWLETEQILEVPHAMVLLRELEMQGQKAEVHISRFQAVVVGHDGVPLEMDDE